jgi:hypothetical protein
VLPSMRSLFVSGAHRSTASNPHSARDPFLLVISPSPSPRRIGLFRKNQLKAMLTSSAQTNTKAKWNVTLFPGVTTAMATGTKIATTG